MWQAISTVSSFQLQYDVSKPGCRGGGGYYETVVGFGWTNGVILDFLDKYGATLEAPSSIPDKDQLGCSCAGTPNTKDAYKEGFNTYKRNMYEIVLLD